MPEVRSLCQCTITAAIASHSNTGMHASINPICSAGAAWAGRGALVAQRVEHILVQLALRGRAQRERDGHQRMHLLILLQDLIVLRAALVVLLHPATGHMRSAAPSPGHSMHTAPPVLLQQHAIQGHYGAPDRDEAGTPQMHDTACKQYLCRANHSRLKPL